MTWTYMSGWMDWTAISDRPTSIAPLKAVLITLLYLIQQYSDTMWYNVIQCGTMWYNVVQWLREVEIKPLFHKSVDTNKGSNSLTSFKCLCNAFQNGNQVCFTSSAKYPSVWLLSVIIKSCTRNICMYVKRYWGSETWDLRSQKTNRWFIE